MGSLWRGWGTVSCIAAAAFSAFVFHNSRFKEFIPFFFIAVIALVARKFGTWSGVLSTIGSTAIFALFLFEPIFSVWVSDSVQRNNLVWMVIGGVTSSEILGSRPPTRSKSDGKGA
jgi:K+-sensing histidine kinase KdpD